MSSTVLSLKRMEKLNEVNQMIKKDLQNALKEMQEAIEKLIIDFVEEVYDGFPPFSFFTKITPLGNIQVNYLNSLGKWKTLFECSVKFNDLDVNMWFLSELLERITDDEIMDTVLQDSESKTKGARLGLSLIELVRYIDAKIVQENEYRQLQAEYYPEEDNELDGLVKVLFPETQLQYNFANGCESMWVKVPKDIEKAEKEGELPEGTYEGILDNDAVCFPGLVHGTPIEFEKRNHGMLIAVYKDQLDIYKDLPF